MLENKLPDTLIGQNTPWRHDPRSRKYSHHEMFGTLGAAAIPATLGRVRRTVENQKNTLRCTGYGSAVNGGYIHGMRMHPDWQAAKVGQAQGQSVDVTGGDPNAAMRAERDAGFIPYTMVPAQLTLESNTIENTGWHAFDPALDTQALNYREAGFVTVDGTNDTFDNIRSALTLAYDPKTGLGATVQVFGKWYGAWDATQGGIIPQSYDTTKYTYHHWLFVDFIDINGVPHLIAHNSAPWLGDHGFQYFPREVINREFVLSGFLYPSGTALKICKDLTQDQINLAKQETTAGLIERLILQAWQAISEIYINRGRA